MSAGQAAHRFHAAVLSRSACSPSALLIWKSRADVRSSASREVIRACGTQRKGHRRRRIVVAVVEESLRLIERWRASDVVRRVRRQYRPVRVQHDVLQAQQDNGQGNRNPQYASVNGIRHSHCSKWNTSGSPRSRRTRPAVLRLFATEHRNFRERLTLKHVLAVLSPGEGFIMRNRGFVGVGVLGLFLCATASSAQDPARYRGFELGSDVAAVSTVTGTTASDLKVIHHSPRPDPGTDVEAEIRRAPRGRPGQPGQRSRWSSVSMMAGSFDSPSTTTGSRPKD